MTWRSAAECYPSAAATQYFECSSAREIDERGPSIDYDGTFPDDPETAPPQPPPPGPTQATGVSPISGGCDDRRSYFLTAGLLAAPAATHGCGPDGARHRIASQPAGRRRYGERAHARTDDLQARTGSLVRRRMSSNTSRPPSRCCSASSGQGAEDAAGERSRSREDGRQGHRHHGDGDGPLEEVPGARRNPSDRDAGPAATSCSRRSARRARRRSTGRRRRRTICART